MTSQEFEECLLYLNSIRDNGNIWIEVEMRHKDKSRFDSLYHQATGAFVPPDSNTAPYYVWPPDADPNSKWGIEMRLYYVSDKNTEISSALNDISKNNSRHGYEKYDKRINNNKFIEQLFQNNYRLGQN